MYLSVVCVYICEGEFRKGGVGVSKARERGREGEKEGECVYLCVNVCACASCTVCSQPSRHAHSVHKLRFSLSISLTSLSRLSLSLFLSVCLSVCLSACLSACQPACLPACPSVCPSVRLFLSPPPSLSLSRALSFWPSLQVFDGG